MMGVWCLSSLLCPRVFYYDYKAKRQQRKWDKENLRIPNFSKAAMMIRCPFWTPTAPRHSSPTPETLLCTMVRPRASWQTVSRDGGLEPSCFRAHFLHLIFLLLLSSASWSLLLPLLCILTFLSFSFLLPPLQSDFTMVRLSWSCYN